NMKEVNKFADTLFNPLIERVQKVSYTEIKKNDLPLKAPVVVLKKHDMLRKIRLSTASKEEMLKIGTEGIQNEDGTRRGPLALDLSAMEAIKAHFLTLKRDPTDIELEALAQTWSEHC